MPVQVWTLANTRSITLDRPRIMAILNVTPDSFADGGRLGDGASIVHAAQRAVEDGADMLDIGGESTRPGAERVDAAEQIDRVVPAVRAVREAGLDIPISVDTTLAPVARGAIDAGADAINDVSAGREDAAMLGLAAERGCGLVLMHRLAPPGDDRYSDAYTEAPRYDDVVAEVARFLGERVDAALRAGVDRGSIVIDPGLGFGKSVEQNLALIEGTGRLVRMGLPVLSALSRKSFVGRVSLGRDSEPGERLAGTLGLSVRHLGRGARVFRVHDVAPHRQCLDAALRSMGQPGEGPGGLT